MTAAAEPPVQQLLPLPAAELPLTGLYLDRERERLQPGPGTTPPVVYANFVTSLDGRIAVGAGERGAEVPDSMTTPSDWRLFQELQAHADGLITHGAYLRALGEGRLGNILQIGTREESADLLAWRRARGIRGQPAVIVASSSLDFLLPDSLREHGQRVMVLTPRGAAPWRVQRLREAGADVRITGDEHSVGAGALVGAAVELGCRRVYLQSGPVVLEAMLRERLLTRLYLTISTQLIGGEAFHSLLAGQMMGRAGRLTLETLYHLAGARERPAQLFAGFGLAHRGGSG